MKTKIITFHSYKGGSGRTSTTINTLPCLVETLGADAKHPILMIDMDLDSAGMTYLLKLDEHFGSRDSYDAKKFLIGSELRWSDEETDDILNHELISKFVPVGNAVGVENGSVLFLGVNDRLSYDNNQMSGGKENYIKKLYSLCKNNNLPAIIMDSASGDQFAAQLATQKATEIVCCMRPTFQFRKGTFNYLSRSAEKNANTLYILLPTVVPVKDVELEGESQKEAAIESIRWNIGKLKQMCEKEGKRLNINETFIDPDMFGINEVQRFKWHEGVLNEIKMHTELVADEVEAFKRYHKLAEVIKEH